MNPYFDFCYIDDSANVIDNQLVLEVSCDAVDEDWKGVIDDIKHNKIAAYTKKNGLKLVIKYYGSLYNEKAWLNSLSKLLQIVDEFAINTSAYDTNEFKEYEEVFGKLHDYLSEKISEF